MVMLSINRHEPTGPHRRAETVEDESEPGTALGNKTCLATAVAVGAPVPLLLIKVMKYLANLTVDTIHSMVLAR